MTNLFILSLENIANSQKESINLIALLPFVISFISVITVLILGFLNYRLSSKSHQLSILNIEMAKQSKKIDVSTILYEKRFNAVELMYLEVKNVMDQIESFYYKHSDMKFLSANPLEEFPIYDVEILKQEIENILSNLNELRTMLENHYLTIHKNIYNSINDFYSDAYQKVSTYQYSLKKENKLNISSSDFHSDILPSYRSVLKSCNQTYELNFTAEEIDKIFKPKKEDPVE